MNITPYDFNTIFSELIDENPLACRGVLRLCGVEFTDAIATAQVTLGERSVLRVNLDFLRTHCSTPEHVKAVLLHEFLHVVLGHTRRFQTVSNALNLAADAVVNAIIHRTCGYAYSSFFNRFYAPGRGGLVDLLCSAADGDLKTSPTNQETLHLWTKLYNGEVSLDDVYQVVCAEGTTGLHEALKSGRLVFLGNHTGEGVRDLDLPPEISGQLDFTQSLLRTAGSIPGGALSGESLLIAQSEDPALKAWRETVSRLLRRLATPDLRNRARHLEPQISRLPVLHEGDRRATLQAGWSPFIPEANWLLPASAPAGRTAVYLDVSGSMNEELKRLSAILLRFRHLLKLPFWAFSNTVSPAEFRQGKLVTGTTKGTEIGCVVAHLKATRPAKALVITDGFVEAPRSGWQETLARHGVEFLISSGGTTRVVGAFERPVHSLPALPK